MKTTSTKKVKRWGTSLILVLGKDDTDILKLKKGDELKVTLEKGGVNDEAS